MYRIVVLLLLSPSMVLCNDLSEVRIVGGKNARIQDFPYQASLQFDGRHFCGASIISESYMITAAHCVNGMRKDRLSVNFGSPFVQFGGTSRNVSEIIQHYNYNNVTTDYDVALLKLDRNLTFTESIAPIALPGYQEHIPASVQAVVTGWGYTKEEGTVSLILQQVKVPIVNLRICSALYSKMVRITPRMLCAGRLEGGVDACQGDSGGPLAVNGKLVGIVSWGYGCARPNYPGVYTNVPAVRKWITKTMNSATSLRNSYWIQIIFSNVAVLWLHTCV